MTVQVKSYTRVVNGVEQLIEAHDRSDHATGYKQLPKREVDMDAIRKRRGRGRPKGAIAPRRGRKGYKRPTY